MIKLFFTLFAFVASAFVASNYAFAVTGSLYPSMVLKNQFGETSINSVTGGTVLDCNFTVASTDAAGKGITGLSGSACNSVFMHTTQTPATGNPNPANGYIIVNLKSQFYGFNGAAVSLVPTPNPTPTNVTSGVTSGNPYIISSVGSTTAAQWQSIGLAVGITPAIGAAFIASTTGTATGTGAVEAPGTVGGKASIIDMIGNPALGGAATAGGQMILRIAAPTNSSTTTLIPVAPYDGTVIGLHFVLLPLSTQLK